MCLIRTAREWSNPAVTEDTLLLLAGALAVPYVITSVGIVPYVAGQKGRRAWCGSSFRCSCLP